MSKSSTTILEAPAANTEDWLPNPHAGDILLCDFMQPLGLDAAALAERVLLPASRITDILTGDRRIDADLDLRLARYFGMSEGFFLGLQTDYELLEARRAFALAITRDLDRITPRAA
jgi:antitoxin HigA-1